MKQNIFTTKEYKCREMEKVRVIQQYHQSRENMDSTFYSGRESLSALTFPMNRKTHQSLMNV